MPIRKGLAFVEAIRQDDNSFLAAGPETEGRMPHRQVLQEVDMAEIYTPELLHGLTEASRSARSRPLVHHPDETVGLKFGDQPFSRART
jgi:hypothetical protein